MSQFDQSYAELNNSQRLAVDTIDGPVLVVAGPGTGKTQLLSMRAANILKNTDVSADNVLCLTFTNKAAINMQERIFSLTGSPKKPINVKTFHSFSAEVMNSYPDYFWNGAKLSTAPELIQNEIIYKILSKLPLNNPLTIKFSGQFTSLTNVKEGLKLAKEAGLTPDKLRRIINLNLSYLDTIEPLLVEIFGNRISYKNLDKYSSEINKLPNQAITNNDTPLLNLDQVIKSIFNNAIAADKESDKNSTAHTSREKSRFLQNINGQLSMAKERKNNQWWLALADVYEMYRDHLHKRRFYDYSDMLVEVINVLETNTDLLSDLQEKYLYTLIDEFQDTNSAQMRLAHLISDHPVNNGKPNLMVVGDDDQSIYKFNGAELNNILQFKKNYPDSAIIVLDKNYRSTQAIIDVSTNIINNADNRLSDLLGSSEKQLFAASNLNQSSIVHYSFTTRDHQFLLLADKIKTEFSNQSSVAVLARSHESLVQMAKSLTQNSVPISYQKQDNILDNPAIKQILYILSLIEITKTGDFKAANQLVFELLRHPMWNLSPLELWDLAIENSKSKNSDWIKILGKSSNKKLNNIISWLNFLIQKSSTESLNVLIDYIIGLRVSEKQALSGPIKEYYISSAKNIDYQYLQFLSAIRLLINFVEESTKATELTIKSFVDIINNAISNGEIIADESSFATKPRSVHLLTVHKAKGLEFDSVFIIDAIDTKWQPRAGSKNPPTNLPLKPPLDDFNDYARLMYVAATRAKNNLYISSYKFDEKESEVLPSILIESLPTEEISTTNLNETIEVLENRLAWPDDNNIAERDLLRPLVKDYELSATGLLDFVDSEKGPRYFIEKHILRLPEASNPSSAYGIAIHSALEYAQVQINLDKFNLSAVKDHFKRILAQQSLPEFEYLRRKEHGLQVIDRLMTDNRLSLTAGSLPEQNINQIMIGKALAKGVIDRLDISNNTISVVDYKTSSAFSSFETKAISLQHKIWRNRTQLLFYVQLLKNSSRFDTSNKQILPKISFVESDNSNNLYVSFTPNDKELSELYVLIQAVYSMIQQVNLPDVSSYKSTHQGTLDFISDILNNKFKSLSNTK